MKKVIVFLLAVVCVFGTFGAMNWAGDIVEDHFENGIIDSNLWTVGGSSRSTYGGPGGPWSYLNEEVVASDGYLSSKVLGPTSGNTFGAEAWARTNYNFNDGNPYLINFTWEPVILDNYYNAFSIQITDGYIDPNGDPQWLLSDYPRTANFLHSLSNPALLLSWNYPDPGIGKESWSIMIDPSGIATLYDSPNAAGEIIWQETLDHSYPWHVRFVVHDATSAGFQAVGAELRLYEFSTISSEAQEAINRIKICAGIPEIHQFDEVLFCGSEIVSLIPVPGVDALKLADDICELLEKEEYCEVAFTAFRAVVAQAANIASGSPAGSIANAALSCAEQELDFSINEYLCDPKKYIFTFVWTWTLSPVHISITDENGESVWLDENADVNTTIPGGAWIFKLSGDQELALVANPIGTYLITITGKPEAMPGDTFTLHVYSPINETGGVLVIYENVPVQSTSIAKTSAGENVTEFSLELDIDGDGIVDEIVAPSAIALNGNFIPIADAGPDQTVPAGTNCMSIVTLDGSGSSDADGDPLSYTWTWDGGSVSGINPTIQLPLGTPTITLVVNDGVMDSDSDSVEITVIDTTPPEITLSVTPDTLWPPNHKMVEVSVDVSAADNCDSNPVCMITSVASNESMDGLGDGDTAPDWEITGDLTLKLRVERSGQGDGRMYTITVDCTDASGNTSTQTVEVTVPHDKGKKKGKK